MPARGHHVVETYVPLVNKEVLEGVIPWLSHGRILRRRYGVEMVSTFEHIASIAPSNHAASPDYHPMRAYEYRRSESAVVYPHNWPDAGSRRKQWAGKAIHGWGVVGVLRMAVHRGWEAVRRQEVEIGLHANSCVTIRDVIIGAQSGVGADVVRARTGAGHDLSVAGGMVAARKRTVDRCVNGRAV